MSVTPDARKRAEMAAKLDAAPAEFAAWRAEAETAPLDKHRSQIRRVTTRLEALAARIRADLDGAGDGLLTEWTTGELLILDLHHLWDFFRAKFALRYPPFLRQPLIVADELVWACYRPAQEAATESGGVSLAAVREPPLTFFGIDSTPAALSRHSVYEVSGAANRLYTKEFGAELRSLPVPVIAMPWHQIGHLPDLLLLAHETGHHVEDDFRLTGDLRAACRAGVGEVAAAWWLPRLGETFADVYGVLGAGAAYVTALIDFLAAPAATLAAEVAPARYPNTALRVRVALAALAQTCPDDPRAGALRSAWLEAVPDHALSRYDDDVEPLVSALLTHPFPVFGGVPLPEVLSFRRLRRQAEVDVAGLAQPNRPLGGGNPRGLLAAAALMFAEDPAAYARATAGPRAARAVVEQQTAGPRFRGGGDPAGDLGAVDAIDRAAAAELHARLREAISQ